MIRFAHKFETRNEAETVIWQMRDIADAYGFANMLDLKNLVGRNSVPEEKKLFWTPEEWRKARVVRHEDKWRIEYPGPKYDLPESRATAKVSYIDRGKKQEDLSAKPLHITVELDSVEDFGDTMSELFVHIRSVTDREVHIVIK